MAAAGNLLFVTLPDQDKVLIINSEAMTITDEIPVPGNHPHTVILSSD